MYARPDRSDRIKAAMGTAALQVLLLGGLILGLRVDVPVAREVQRLFNLAPIESPPPRIVPPPPRRPREEVRAGQRPDGGSAPPNLRAEPTEIRRVEPIVQLPVPPPVVTAPAPAQGSAPSAGAADVAGPGTGSGGRGRGSGWGDGDGDGEGGGIPPRLIRGRIRDSDYPRGLGEAGISGTVAVRYSVETDGRVGECLITRSSGSDLLDATTCRLIQQRFRFAPSRDRAGRPVRSIIVENHSWLVRDEPPEEEYR